VAPPLAQTVVNVEKVQPSQPVIVPPAYDSDCDNGFALSDDEAEEEATDGVDGPMPFHGTKNDDAKAVGRKVLKDVGSCPGEKLSRTNKVQAESEMMMQKDKEFAEALMMEEFMEGRETAQREVRAEIQSVVEAAKITIQEVMSDDEEAELQSKIATIDWAERLEELKKGQIAAKYPDVIKSGDEYFEQIKVLSTMRSEFLEKVQLAVGEEKKRRTDEEIENRKIYLKKSMNFQELKATDEGTGCFDPQLSGLMANVNVVFDALGVQPVFQEYGTTFTAQILSDSGEPPDKAQIGPNPTIAIENAIQKSNGNKQIW
jgi:hypothetical protein